MNHGLDWKIKVQVVTEWTCVIRTNGRGGALNIIIIDENENRMHVSVPSSVANLLDQVLVVDETYEIENFKLVMDFTSRTPVTIYLWGDLAAACDTALQNAA
ncbi:hypothetical protein AgCh_035585 [Apium graveolens]